MAEKKTTKAAATKTTAAKKTTAKKAEAPKAAAAKKTTTKKAAAPAVALNVENVGFKAGDVYQTLASAAKALTVAEIAKAAKIAEAEVLLGAGWLLKEGKIKGENDTLALA